MRLIAVLLLAGALGLPSAMAADRGDALLRAFRDVCFPRPDVEALRRKAMAAGFARVPPGESIPELGLVKITGNATLRWWPVFEVYRVQREGIGLFAIFVVKVNPRSKDKYTACQVHDPGATETASAKKMAEWIGRSADVGYSARTKRRSGWVSDISRYANQRWMIVGAAEGGALPGGYHEIMSTYEEPGSIARGEAVALLGATPGAVLAAKTISNPAK
jgi:hypothetical protein